MNAAPGTKMCGSKRQRIEGRTKKLQREIQRAGTVTKESQDFSFLFLKTFYNCFIDIQFIHVKCTMQWFLVYIQSCAAITTINFILFICLFVYLLAMPCGLRDLNFLTRDQTPATAVNAPSPNHWTTGPPGNSQGFLL